MRTLAIIGAGFSGLAVALHLARDAADEWRTVLVDDGPSPGLGVAYGTQRQEHLLNVPAGRMSAFPDDPEHLLRWFRANGHAHAPTDFIPRALYGAYLRALLAEITRAGHTRLERSRCVALDHERSGVTLTLKGGARLHTDAAVLALGNGTPVPLRFRTREGVARDPRIVQNPWGPDPLGEAAANDHVVLIGTGLTAIDMVLTLDAMGHKGRITTISRRGLLPRVHAVGAPGSGSASARHLIVGRRPLQALRAVREACDREALSGGDWRATIDSLRPHTADAWQAWSGPDRERFCRFLRPFWDVHRHRMAPSIGARIGSHLGSGRLRIVRARVREIEASGNDIQVQTTHGRPEFSLITAEVVVNCVGPNTDPSRWGDPLIDAMLRSGSAQVDPLGLGLETDDTGRLVGSADAAPGVVYAMGPLRRPALWESIAVPELRVQALALSDVLREIAADGTRAGERHARA